MGKISNNLKFEAAALPSYQQDYVKRVKLLNSNNVPNYSFNVE